MCMLLQQFILFICLHGNFQFMITHEQYMQFAYPQLPSNTYYQLVGGQHCSLKIMEDSSVDLGDTHRQETNSPHVEKSRPKDLRFVVLTIHIFSNHFHFCAVIHPGINGEWLKCLSLVKLILIFISAAFPFFKKNFPHPLITHCN